MLDLILKNGRVVDGTGNPWFSGDVGVKDGLIASVGRSRAKSLETIDVDGLTISPGFIDGHCHSDLMVLDRPESEIKLAQGVTTEVVGNCGMSPAPFSPARLAPPSETKGSLVAVGRRDLGPVKRAVLGTVSVGVPGPPVVSSRSRRRRNAVPGKPGLPEGCRGTGVTLAALPLPPKPGEQRDGAGESPRKTVRDARRISAYPGDGR